MGPRGRRMRRRGLVVGMAAGAAMSNRGNQGSDDSTQAQAAPTNDAPTADDQMAQLEKLGQLKAEGILTEEEFQAKKKQILGI